MRLQVLILGNQYAADPDEEDSENILRVIALKNYCAKVKVLVQILQYYNTVSDTVLYMSFSWQ